MNSSVAENVSLSCKSHQIMCSLRTNRYKYARQLNKLFWKPNYVWQLPEKLFLRFYYKNWSCALFYIIDPLQCVSANISDYCQRDLKRKCVALNCDRVSTENEWQNWFTGVQFLSAKNQILAKNVNN